MTAAPRLADPRLLALATAVPPYVLDQSVVADFARRLFADTTEIHRLLPVFGNAGIDTRYSCVPLDWYDRQHDWEERNGLYLQNAVALLEKAAREALDTAGIDPAEIDAIVVNSTTGIATPSLDAILIGRLGLRPDVRRLPIFGLGCAGGVLGLARAVDMARVAPGSKVLFLVVELCALCFRKGDLTKSAIVASALFGDGAAALVLSTEGDGPTFGASGEHTWPNSLDIMGWDVANDGLKALFSRDIPRLVRQQLREVVARFLDRQGLGLGDIGRFVSHPGGSKVLTALEEAFGLEDGALVEGHSVLRDYGNMSAATVLFVLKRTLENGAKGRMLLTAMGPGFSAGFQMLEAA